MERLLVLICLCLACVLSSSMDPRGARPVEPATRSEECATKKEWPFCTDDDWGHKCPSGCRIQGLMDKIDHSMLKRIEKFRNILEQNTVNYRSTNLVTKQTYDFLTDKLTRNLKNNNNFLTMAQALRENITSLKSKIDEELGVLAALKDTVKEQVEMIQRLEVDIDIKLRACKGSCSSYSEYQVDKDSYVALGKQINQLDAQAGQRVNSIQKLSVMKSKQVKDVAVESHFKSAHSLQTSPQKTQDIFEEVKAVELFLDSEGSKTSPATVSKDPGTSYSMSTSSSSPSGTSSSSSSSTSKSITELGGDSSSFGTGIESSSHSSTGHVSTKTVSCTKSQKTLTIQTSSGPQKTVEAVIEGGPECHLMTDSTKGGMEILFPTLGHTSSSSHSTGTITDYKSKLPNVFSPDMDGFLTEDPEEDLPDIQARSVKSVRVQRQADYVGADCVEAYQNHLRGETNGLFKIKPGGTNSTGIMAVYCQQEGLMGGWLLVQQREGGALSFNRSWAEYRDGFGSVDTQGKGELWLGNQNLHLLTNRGETMAKVKLEDWEGRVATAEYVIRVGSEGEGYQLHVSGYVGDAGDALVKPKSATQSNNGMKFSTFDRDNDRSEGNCAEMFGAGWWYNNCQSANLNGLYSEGVVWPTFKHGNNGLKTVKVFIRPAAF